MLTGFFKNPQEKDCICSIVAYYDRIWLDEKGDASVFRNFIVAVDEGSQHPLSEVRSLIPFKSVLNPKDKSETCFNKSFHLNDRGRGGRFKIKTLPVTLQTPSASAVGSIDDDGFEDVKVFTGNTIQITPFFDGSLLTWQLPVPLNPGELCEVRLSFSITSLFENEAPGTRTPSYKFETRYFDDRICETAFKQLDRTTEIPVKPTMGPPKGGFDIIVYLPPDFGIGRVSPSDAEIFSDKTYFDKKGETSLTSYIWRARKIHEKATNLRASETPFTLKCFNISPPDTMPQDIEEMKAKTGSIEGRIQGVEKSTQLIPKIERDGKLALVLAVLAILLSLVPLGVDAYKYFRSNHQKRNCTFD